MVEPVLKDFNKGPIFVKDTDILLTGDRWTIAANIALDDYIDLIGSMKLIIKQIQQKTQTQKHVWTTSTNLYWGEMDRSTRIVQGLEDDFKIFQILFWKKH
jgi:hypothetical protein